MEKSDLKILVIEDNPGDADLIQAFLEDSEETVYDLRTVERLALALKLLEGEVFDLILSDLDLPDSLGLEIVRKLLDKAPRTPVVVMTGLSDDDTLQKALSMGAKEYLVKGRIDADSLQAAIRRVAHQQ